MDNSNNVPRASLAFMEIKNIVAASFGEDGRRCYKVHWKDSWVYDSHLAGCAELIEVFWKEQKKTELAAAMTTVATTTTETTTAISMTPTSITSAPTLTTTTTTTTTPTTTDSDNSSKRRRTSESTNRETPAADAMTSDETKDIHVDTLVKSVDYSELERDWMLDSVEDGGDELRENDGDWEIDPLTKRMKQSGHPYALTCDMCGEDCEFVTAFKRHYMDRHPGVKPFACDMCEKRFDRKENLSRHIRIHTGDRRYVCNHCGKGYTDSSGLKKHVVSKHTTPVDTTVKLKAKKASSIIVMLLKCSLCGLRCKDKETLELHVANHLSGNTHAQTEEASMHNDENEQIVVLDESSPNTSRESFFENNSIDTVHSMPIALVSGGTGDERIVETSSIESESEVEILREPTESLQDAVEELQRYVNSDHHQHNTPSQVVRYIQMTAATNPTTGNNVDLTTEPDNLVTQDSKQFIFTSDTTHQIIPMSSHQVMTSADIAMATHLPNNSIVPAANASTQIITVPIATSVSAFVYTGGIVSDLSTSPNDDVTPQN